MLRMRLLLVRGEGLVVLVDLMTIRAVASSSASAVTVAGAFLLSTAVTANVASGCGRLGWARGDLVRGAAGKLPQAEGRYRRVDDRSGVQVVGPVQVFDGARLPELVDPQ